MQTVIETGKEIIKLFTIRRPTLENIIRGVGLAQANCTRYVQGKDGYWVISFADPNIDDLEITQTAPAEIAAEIRNHIFIERSFNYGK